MAVPGPDVQEAVEDEGWESRPQGPVQEQVIRLRFGWVFGLDGAEGAQDELALQWGQGAHLGEAVEVVARWAHRAGLPAPDRRAGDAQ